MAEALNNLGIVLSDLQTYSEAESLFEESLNLTQNFQLSKERLNREFFYIILSNFGKVLFNLNKSLDILFDYTDDDNTIEKIEILNGWRLIKEGHINSSKGNWKKAAILIDNGEKLINNSLSLKNSKHIWLSVRRVENDVY